MQEPSLTIVLVSVIAVLGGSLAFLAYRTRASRRASAAAGSHYHALIEASPNGVLIADASTLRIIAANTALQKSLGYSLDQLRSLTLTQIFADESAEPESLSAR